METQQGHDVYSTSLQRRCNLMTLHRRWYIVASTSCAHWECSRIFESFGYLANVYRDLRYVVSTIFSRCALIMAQWKHVPRKSNDQSTWNNIVSTSMQRLQCAHKNKIYITSSGLSFGRSPCVISIYLIPSIVILRFLRRCSILTMFSLLTYLYRLYYI